MKIAGFEWDEGNWPKCGRHGVKQTEIEHVLAATKFVIDDPSTGEKRFQGRRTEQGRAILVCRLHIA